ncbi:TPA: lysozyme [Klebsiella pneumoniae]|nr:lysozyme [Klebsiella pneumoniae]HBR3765182.1 lysozyme [Klebsiella pneumoniae]HBT0122488.1 lysozyme [Klebsiella pneumoniae]HBT0150111.1 lysozyme [Klebsiella pneumoniae]HBT0528220.1 lysozyme [Klebsiella pneumoniae]
MSQIVKRCSVAAVLAIAALLPQYGSLQVSQQGLQLIADAEGCRTEPYQCSAGVWTNGIGHTEGVTPKSIISERQAAVSLILDVLRVQRGLAACIDARMPQQVYDAVVSFAFNVGVFAACSSTLAAYLRQGEWRDACLQLSRWVFVKGVRNKGLENRREREINWCLKGV